MVWKWISRENAWNWQNRRERRIKLKLSWNRPTVQKSEHSWWQTLCNRRKRRKELFETLSEFDFPRKRQERINSSCKLWHKWNFSWNRRSPNKREIVQSGIPWKRPKSKITFWEVDDCMTSTCRKKLPESLTSAEKHLMLKEWKNQGKTKKSKPHF